MVQSDVCSLGNKVIIRNNNTVNMFQPPTTLFHLYPQYPEQVFLFYRADNAPIHSRIARGSRAPCESCLAVCTQLGRKVDESQK